MTDVAQTGNEVSALPSLAEFAGEHGTSLTRFAYLLCRDAQRAEDLVQEAYLALYRRFGEYLEVQAPIAYARKIVVNTYLSAERLRSAGEQVTDEVPDRGVHDVDVDLRDALWRALAAIPTRQRAVLVMRHYAAMRDDEIAAALGARPGTVRSLAARAMERLRADPNLREEHR